MIISTTNVSPVMLKEILESSSKATSEAILIDAIEPIEIFEGQLSLFGQIYMEGELTDYEI